MPAAQPVDEMVPILLEALENRLLLSAHVRHPRPQPIFTPLNLVSDVAGQAQRTEPLLVNAWGLAPGGSLFWVAANGSDVALTVPTSPTAGPSVFTVPSPTGIALNNTSAFSVTNNGSTGPANYLIASEDGGIFAWRAPADSSTVSTSATRVISTPGAVYKGIALFSNFGAPLIYAANFSGGTVDVFDGQFNPVNLSGNTARPAFTDPRIPAGFAPFNIAPFGRNLIVTYALQGAGGNQVRGDGFGFVDMFTPQGLLLRHFIARGHFNAPWGVSVAPSDFGRFAGDILIGNFGDGRINAFSSSGKFIGQLADKDGNPVEIDGLWALSARSNTLFFAAGPDEEAHGLFGELLRTGTRIPTT